MATALSNIRSQIKFSADLIADLLGASFVRELLLSIPFGNAAGQVNALVGRSVAVPTATPLDIDLTAVADVAGAVVNMTKLLGWMLINQSTTPGQNYLIGGGANPIIAAALPIPVQAGSFEFKLNLDTGTTVDGTHKTFRLATAAGTPAGILLLFARH